MTDVPSSIDLKNIHDARQWAEEAMIKRPYREQIFSEIYLQLERYAITSVLELGSGPGFLALYLMSRLPKLQYVGLDNSEAMHSLAKDRLGALADSITFINPSFLEPQWCKALQPVDAVVTMQAVHELRHKFKALQLFKELKTVLKDEGVFLYCDHVCDERGMKNTELFMNESEQQQALSQAAFGHIEKICRYGSLVLWCAKK